MYAEFCKELMLCMLGTDAVYVALCKELKLCTLRSVRN